MNSISVSVIIPTFNRSALLHAAIDSVLRQTHPVREIIVIDDGSSDETPALMPALAARIQAPRVISLRQSNLGPAAARNAGVAAATGSLIAFLDDDDIWHAEKLERQVTALAEKPELALLACATDAFKLPGRSRLVPIGEWKLLFRNWFMTSSVVARRDIILACGGFPEDTRHCEDYALWLQVASRHQCSFLNEVLVSYGNGKRGFGYSGLSADLDALYAGECNAIKHWRAVSDAGVPAFVVARTLAAMRHFRRRIVAAVPSGK